jgi:hypothetical protein
LVGPSHDGFRLGESILTFLISIHGWYFSSDSKYEQGKAATATATATSGWMDGKRWIVDPYVWQPRGLQRRFQQRQTIAARHGMGTMNYTDGQFFSFR